MKLWEKDINTSDAVMKFTVGNDPEYDKLLAPYDIVASMAHAIMLGTCGLLSVEESEVLVKELAAYFPEVKKDHFSLNPDDEDIHSHLENYLVTKAGEAGKKIHTARSRNDQVLTAMQLLMKEEWRILLSYVDELFDAILIQAEKFKDILFPGYTHTQTAMPSSFGIWLGAYAESLVNDLSLSKGIVEVLDQNPLGSAAGYGSSFPIDRELTTSLLGFKNMHVSSVSAQLNRGKMESLTAIGLSSFGMTLSRMAADMIFFMCQDLGFISFSEELTTGSSIMPHKKNPDVLELIRAHCNTLIQLPTTIASLSSNLISGYHRDLQLSKEYLIPGIDRLKQCLSMMKLMVESMIPAENILMQEKYKYVFSVDVVNTKVMSGKSFRDAYKEVALEIKEGSYKPEFGHKHTHTGSIGNPGLEKISKKKEQICKDFNIKSLEDVFEELLER